MVYLHKNENIPSLFYHWLLKFYPMNLYYLQEGEDILGHSFYQSSGKKLKAVQNQYTNWLRADLPFDWPTHKGYRWSNWAEGKQRIRLGCGKLLHLYQAELLGRSGWQATPPWHPHSCTQMKSLICQLELNTESLSTLPSLSLSLLPCGHTDPRVIII